MRKFLCFAIALVFMLTPIISAMNFTDVHEGDWYYEDVRGAVESGIINGKTPTEYKPDDNLTYAETVKLAACMHQLYTTGKVTLENGSPVWYSTYVEYCKKNSIISFDYDYNIKAERGNFICIFANALPEEALKQINNVEDGSIPDALDANAPAVYKLYRAGIVQGVDEKHRCKPYDHIKRSEVAAIITRMMNEDKRVKFSMVKAPVHDHTYISEIEPPTCTERGYIRYTCSICGHKYSTMYSYEREHMYSREVIAPTATEQGYTLNTCACGHSFKNKYVAALDADKAESEPKQVPGSGFINTAGRPTSERGRAGLVAGEFAVNRDGYITPRIDKNLLYMENLSIFNGYIFSLYNVRMFADGLSLNDLEKGRFAKIVVDSGRYGIEVFQWRKSYDSDSATNSEINAVMEAMYFICGDREVAYALWSWQDAMSVNGSANSNDFGFRDVKSTNNGGIIEMNGIQIEVDFSGVGQTFYFE